MRASVFLTTFTVCAVSALPLACGPEENRAPVASTHDTTESEYASRSLPDADTAAAPETPQISGVCTADLLSLSVEFREAGAGNRAVVFALRNDASDPCTLQGYPGITPVDSSSAPLAGIDVVESENTYFTAENAAEVVRLDPGKLASFMVTFGAVETEGETCVDAAGLYVTPPRTSDSLYISEPLYRICTGEVRVTPIILGIPEF